MLSKITLALVFAVAVLATVPASAQSDSSVKQNQCAPYDGGVHWLC